MLLGKYLFRLTTDSFTKSLCAWIPRFSESQRHLKYQAQSQSPFAHTVELTVTRHLDKRMELERKKKLGLCSGTPI